MIDIGETREMHEEVKFKIADHTFSYIGTVAITPERKYDYEKKKAGETDRFIRFGAHYIDKLQITLLCDAVSYENLYHQIVHNDFFFIGFFTKTGFVCRSVRQKLPLPARLRFLDDSVSFSLETERYTNPSLHQIDALEHWYNFKWNEATIDVTMWNGNGGNGSYQPTETIYR